MKQKNPKRRESTMTEKRTRRTFTPEFKSQVVRLYESGKPRADIIREYDLTASAFDKWVKQSQASGSFKESRNNYGTRKIKIELEKKGLTVSRRRIGRIMK